MSGSQAVASGEAGPQFDIAAVRGHVELLHGRAVGVDGVFVVTARYVGQEDGTITHHRPGDVEGMCAAIMAHAETPGANVYTGLQLMRPNLPRKRRGGESDVVAVIGLVADLDRDTGKIGAMPVEPSYAIETSPGNQQSVLLFDRPISPKVAKPLAIALGAATGADYGTKDVSHVWRIPGTLNWPDSTKLARGRSPEPATVRLLCPFDGVVYTIDALREALAAHVPSTNDTETRTVFAKVDSAPLLARVTDKARDLLTADIANGERSEHAARVVEQLGFEGFSLDESVSLCLDHAGSWRGRYKTDAALSKDVGRLWAKLVQPKRNAAAENALAAERVIPKAANDNEPAKVPARLTGIAASELQHKIFPPIKYVVPGFITEGCTLLAGRPKLGKSWLALDIALAVARGSTCLGDIKCEPGSVLCLALEDNERRLHSRIEKLMPFTFPAQPWPANLRLEWEWPRANAGGIKQIEEWAASHHDARLVVVDVLAMFRPLATGKNTYQEDFLAVKALQEIASRHSIAVLVLHHAKKGSSESGDPFELISGTYGLSGAADTALVLDRDSSGATLAGRGRDVEEVNAAVTFEKLTCKWRVLGEATEVRRTDERKAILSFLIDCDEPASPDKIAAAIGMQRNGVNQLLFKMGKAGEVVKTGRGKYQHPEKVGTKPPDKIDKKVRSESVAA